MRAEVLLQDISTAGIEWDDVLPSELQRKWEQWLKELSDLSTVAISRCLCKPNPVKMDLHMFLDTSKAAYTAVAYLVCKYSDNTFVRDYCFQVLCCSR